MKIREFLIGKEIMGRWKLKPFELLLCVRKGLQPYSQASFQPYRFLSFTEPTKPEGFMPGTFSVLSYVERKRAQNFDINRDQIVSRVEDLLPYISECIFRQKDVEEFEKEHPEILLEKATKSEIKKGEKKLRPEQKAKKECRKVAGKLWKEDPTITIAAMIDRQEIIDVSKHPNGDIYMEKTVRNWIKDLCPNRSAGRRPKN